jgi:hypothetical protein
MMGNACRACGAPLKQPFCDLGLSPISNAFIKQMNAKRGEMFYPLRAMVCGNCWLVQLDDSPGSEAHFHDDYVYFSSFSDGWLAHARRYADAMTARFNLGADSRVLEIASNDGYLLQNFVAAGIPCLGVEPTGNTAAAARQKGVETREWFFGSDAASKLAAEGWMVDLLIGNNVLAHVPDINDFVGGMPLILKAEGVATLEFPHLLNLVTQNQFDTIYHEHYSYLSLIALTPIFERAGLRIFDIDRLTTHGGSLRLFVCHSSARHIEADIVAAVAAQERAAGLASAERFEAFARRVVVTKRELLTFLIDAKSRGKRVAAYGAAAKGNTLLNYCGIRSDMVDFVADRSPAKQGRLLPGSRIPIVSPDAVDRARPDYLLVLPWNIRDEVMAQMAHIRNWGGQFVVPIPALEIIP